MWCCDNETCIHVSRSWCVVNWWHRCGNVRALWLRSQDRSLLLSTWKTTSSRSKACWTPTRSCGRSSGPRQIADRHYCTRNNNWPTCVDSVVSYKVTTESTHVDSVVRLVTPAHGQSSASTGSSTSARALTLLSSTRIGPLSTMTPDRVRPSWAGCFCTGMGTTGPILTSLQSCVPYSTVQYQVRRSSSLPTSSRVRESPAQAVDRVQPQRLPDLVDRLHKVASLQMADVWCAMYGHGNYSLAAPFTRFQMPHTAWLAKTEDNKRSHFRSFWR